MKWPALTTRQQTPAPPIKQPAAPQPQPYSRSVERQALADAIARRDAIQAEVGKIDGAIGLTRLRRYTAGVALAEAERAAAEAESNAATHALALGAGDDPDEPPPITPAEARALAAEARAVVDELEANLVEFDGMRKRRNIALQIAQFTVRDRVASVVRASPTTEKLIAEFESVSASVAAMRATLEHLDRRKMLTSTPTSLHPQQKPAPPPAEAWTLALSRLEANADAPLPEG